MRERWLQHITSDLVQHYKKLEDSLHTENGCLIYGARIVILEKLRISVLNLVHLGHFEIK